MTGSLEYALEWTANAIDRGVFTIESRITGTMRAAASLFGRYTLSLSLFEKQLSHFQTQLTHAASRLAGSHENSVLQTREHVQFLERSLANMNPLTVLKRGYAIVSKEGGRSAQNQRSNPVIASTFDSEMENFRPWSTRLNSPCFK